MPEPASKRGEVVTTSPFSAPFETPTYPCGNGGLDLTHAVDAVPVGAFTRLTNWAYTLNEPRALTGRPGQTTYASLGTTHHSILRVNRPLTNDFTHLWGVDTSLAIGPSGALAAIDSGYSGNPLTLLNARPPLSGDPWVFVGDSNKMSKVRASDGLVLPIGLPAPTTPAIPSILPLSDKSIFNSILTPPGFAWTPNAGYYDQPAGSTSTPTPTQVPPAPTGAVFGLPTQDFIDLFLLGTPFFIYWGAAITLDLSVCIDGARDLSGQITPAIDPPPAAGSPVPITDDAIMHLLLTFSQPNNIDEVRLYVVVSENFSPSILPGTQNAANANGDFYMKAFRAGDFAPMLAALASQADQAEVAQVNLLRQQALATAGAAAGFTSPTLRADNTYLAAFDPADAASLEGSTSAAETVPFGVVGNPLHRGDFQRFGSTTGRDWSTVTGLVLYIHAVVTTANPTVNKAITVTMDQWSLKGQGGSDSSDAADSSYDWRYTFYDPRTGAEGNPSPVMALANFKDSLTQVLSIAPGEAAPFAGVVERWYRRGGTLPSDWFFMGQTKADGTAFIDTLPDDDLAAAGTVAINHYQPVPSVSTTGVTILAQPVPILIGPVNGQLLALGDPNQPGFVYASIAGEPDHWDPTFAVEVTAPGEPLMNGAILGTQVYVFSRERAYAIYQGLGASGVLQSFPTTCARGLGGRWAITVGPDRIYFVARDGIYSTFGWGENLVSAAIQPLFDAVRYPNGANGYLPIDFTVEAAIRVEVYQHELWFAYQDTSGARQVLILNLVNNQWRPYAFANGVAVIYEDAGGGPPTLLLGGQSSGKSYTHSGTSDDGAPIAWHLRTGSWDWGKPREEKLFGDQIADLDPEGNALVWTNYVDSETVTNPAQSVPTVTGRSRVIFDGFGTGPQLGRNLAIDISGSGTGNAPILYFLGTSLTLQPDLTVNRVTNWDDLGHPDEKYVFGITFDCDTGGVTRTILIEYDLGGVTNLAATLLVNTNGRHKTIFTWPAVQANQVRIRPDDQCVGWLLYRADWQWQPEPPRDIGWDIWFEAPYDQYYTGLNLYADTFGAAKTIQITVDGVVLNDPATGFAYFTVQTTGRQVVELTLPWGRGRVFHFVATDNTFPGLLYKHEWMIRDEPRTQANWNTPFTIYGTGADKWMKAVVIEADTFNQPKAVTVEVDGVVLETLTVNTNGRRVVQLSLAQQRLGRVFRFFPTDANPSRLYSLQPVFDEEPFALETWQTQEITHGLSEFHSLVEANVTLKSNAPVTVTITAYVNQTGVTVVDTYTIPSTGGVKVKTFLPFFARKAVMYKYLFQSIGHPFWLYQEESDVVIQPWKGGAPLVKRPFGDSDVDETRAMVSSVDAATRSGGGTS